MSRNQQISHKIFHKIRYVRRKHNHSECHTGIFLLKEVFQYIQPIIHFFHTFDPFSIQNGPLCPLFK